MIASLACRRRTRSGNENLPGIICEMADDYQARSRGLGREEPLGCALEHLVRIPKPFSNPKLDRACRLSSSSAAGRTHSSASTVVLNGKAASSGSVLLMKHDIVDLYDCVPYHARIVVHEEPMARLVQDQVAGNLRHGGRARLLAPWSNGVNQGLPSLQ
ncbi:hypothetical protein GGE12_000623 [Rhizobium mongolense]|uniref:Uncharacterized protein n=1 Tax=Rhizobium mongolense TaxID=57676 RepID=A0A7W6RJ74_9HYPH|nr:hypothetical protein [Rhizobium mongolense]MBB4272881.1 hypothetical protein [Rhizobium mongolense]